MIRFLFSKRFVFMGVLAIALLWASQVGVPVYADGDGDNGIGAAPASDAVVTPQGPVLVDGPWYEFALKGVGVPVTGCSPADPAGPGCTAGAGSVFADAPPWTFSGPATLKVTDAFLNGDSFEVFDFGVSIGTTPGVAASGSCGSDPAPCFADPASSSRAFSLGGGAHSITMKPTASPFSSGAAYFRVDAADVRCTLEQDVTFGSGSISLEYLIGSADPATWTVWLILLDPPVAFPAWSLPIPAISPMTVGPVSFPLAGFGIVGVLTVLTTADGVICSDWDTANTGSSAKDRGSLQDLRKLTASPNGLLPR